ncbi:MAG: TonB-dependent receptor [Chakrabartia sp.]
MKGQTQRTFAAFLLAGVGLAGISAPAFAQAAAGNENTGLEEIVVTAQKRTESLQDTPIAITAVPAAQLELRGIAEAKDLSAIAPNVSVVGATTNATAAVVTIRGIPTAADESQGYDSPIGIYVDGVYMARSSASTFEVADIDRVEVLRGPQGTLFGRNTTGGAVNFVTRMPEDEFGITLRGGYGNFNQTNFRMILNTGELADGLKMSFAYLNKSRDGVVDNLLARSGRDPGAMNNSSARWALQYDLSDNLTFTNVLDRSHIESIAGFSQLVAVGNGDPTRFPGTLTLDGNTFAVTQPANVAGYLAEATSLDPQCGTPLSQLSLERRSKVCANSNGLSTDTLWGNMSRFELKTDAVTVRSTTAYREWHNVINGTDLDGMGGISGPKFDIGLPTSPPTGIFQGFSAALLQSAFGLSAPAAGYLQSLGVPTTTQDLFNTKNNRRQKQFSQELEFVSPGGGSFEWVLGGFYFHESGSEYNPQNYAYVLDTNQTVYTPASIKKVLLGFNPSLDPDVALGYANVIAPLMQAGNPARFRALASQTVLAYNAGGSSFAVYGQGTLRPGGADGRLGITLGLRYTWDKKNFQVTQNGAVPYTLEQLGIRTSSKKFSAPTGNLTIDYKASDDVNLYARMARGYRSGGYNARQSTTDDKVSTPLINETIPLTPFKDETIWSYELGAKMEFAKRVRLNLAAFYNVYTDQLVTIPLQVEAGASFGNITVNAGKTEYYGVEAEGNWLVSDHFSLDGSFGYVKKKPVDFPAGDTGNVIRNVASIQELGYSPNYTANIGATAKYPVGSLDMTARVGYNYTSSFWMFGNPLTAPFRNETKGDARGLLDAQLRFDGIGIGKKASVTFWGKNLTNKAYVVRSVDFGTFGYATDIWGDPRTYGVTVDMAF